MSDWKKLNITIDINNITKKELHLLICNAMSPKNGYWIVENNLFELNYKVFKTIEEMCIDIWADWPSDAADDFIEEQKVDPEVPFIMAEHAREYYIMKSQALAEEFLEKSQEAIRNNQTEDDMY